MSAMRPAVRARAAAVAATLVVALASAASAGPGALAAPEVPVGERAPQDRPGIGWPGRGGLALDPAVRRAVAAEMRDWRSPSGRGVYRDGARLVWAGHVDGHVLALVSVIAATDYFDDEPELWTVELSGPDAAHLAVTALTPDLDDLEYDPPLVRAVRSPCCGPRYAVSDDVVRLEHAAAGAPAARLELEDGLSERLPSRPCAASRVMATADYGERVPYADLGQGAVPVLPTLLDADPADGGAALLQALSAVDTCRATEPGTGPLAAVAELGDDEPAPLHRADVLAALPAVLDGPGTLTVLGWTAVQDGDLARHVVWQPATGPAVVSDTIDGRSDFAVVPFPLADGPAVAVVWVGEPLDLLSVTGGRALFRWQGESRSHTPRAVGVAVLRGPAATEARLALRSGWTGETVERRVPLAG